MSLAYVFHGNLLTYSILVAATQGYLYYKRYRQGELRSAQLSAQLAHAQLQMLRMQLHPHFLFNTLNSIATLIHKDPDAADLMTARLSDLLRLTLKNIGIQEVPLAQELEFVFLVTDELNTERSELLQRQQEGYRKATGKIPI